MAIAIMQGDSYPIYINLTQDGDILTPDMFSDLEICVGEIWNYRYSEGTISYDSTLKQWFFWPSQEETISAEGNHAIYGRIKYHGQPPKLFTFRIDRISITPTDFKEVI